MEEITEMKRVIAEAVHETKKYISDAINTVKSAAIKNLLSENDALIDKTFDTTKEEVEKQTRESRLQLEQVKITSMELKRR